MKSLPKPDGDKETPAKTCKDLKLAHPDKESGQVNIIGNGLQKFNLISFLSTGLIQMVVTHETPSSSIVTWRPVPLASCPSHPPPTRCSWSRERRRSGSPRCPRVASLSATRRTATRLPSSRCSALRLVRTSSTTVPTRWPITMLSAVTSARPSLSCPGTIWR